MRPQRASSVTFTYVKLNFCLWSMASNLGKLCVLLRVRTASSAYF